MIFFRKCKCKWKIYKKVKVTMTNSKTFHQTVSTEATLLLRNSAEIDGKGHTNVENMR